MKIKYLLILFFVFSFPICAISQSADFFQVEIGEEYKDDILNYPPEIIGFDEQGYYVFQNKAPFTILVGGFIPIKASKERMYLRRFNHQLAPETSVEINLEGEGKVEEYPVSIAMAPENQMFLFSNRLDKKKQTFQLNLRRINRDNLAIPEAAETIIELDLSKYPKRSTPLLDLAYSRDSSKIMSYYFLSP